MSYALGSGGIVTALPVNLGDIVQRYGPVLLYGSIIYSIIGIIVYLWMVSSGITAPVTLVPPGLGELATKTFSMWGDIYEAFKDGSVSGAEVFKLLGAVTGAALLFMGMMVQSAIAYIWIAVQLSELIPPPYQFMTVIAWVVLGMAQLILLLYIIDRITPYIQSLADTILSIARSLV